MSPASISVTVDAEEQAAMPEYSQIYHAVHARISVIKYHNLAQARTL